MKIEDLKEQPPGVLDALPIAILANLQANADAHLADAQQMVAILHGVLSRKYAAGLNATGTSKRMDGDFEITVNVPKRVDWDANGLAAAISTLRDWDENPDDYIETKRSVAESKYKAWPPKIRDLFTPARTEKAGKPTFKIMELEQV